MAIFESCQNKNIIYRKQIARQHSLRSPITSESLAAVFASCWIMLGYQKWERRYPAPSIVGACSIVKMALRYADSVINADETMLVW